MIDLVKPRPSVAVFGFGLPRPRGVLLRLPDLLGFGRAVIERRELFLIEVEFRVDLLFLYGL
jgi:hypothetical protein